MSNELLVLWQVACQCTDKRLRTHTHTRTHYIAPMLVPTLLLLALARANESPPSLLTCHLHGRKIMRHGSVLYVTEPTETGVPLHYCIPPYYIVETGTNEAPCYRCDPTAWSHPHTDLSPPLLVGVFVLMAIGCLTAARALFTYARAFVQRKTA